MEKLIEKTINEDGTLLWQKNEAGSVEIIGEEAGGVDWNGVIYPDRMGNWCQTEELYLNIKSYLHDNAVMAEADYDLVTLYVMMTWLYEQLEVVPYLVIHGPAGSGKSRLAECLRQVVYHGINGNAASFMPLVRAIDKHRGTLLLDEADLEQIYNASEMMQVYNLGAMRSNPIWRTIETTGPNGEMEWESNAYETFCPKILIVRNLNKLPKGVQEICVAIGMPEVSMSDLEHKNISFEMSGESRTRARLLRRDLLRWKMEHWEDDFFTLPNFRVDERTRREARCRDTLAALKLGTMGMNLAFKKQISHLLKVRFDPKKEASDGE